MTTRHSSGPAASEERGVRVFSARAIDIPLPPRRLPREIDLPLPPRAVAEEEDDFALEPEP